MIKLEHVKVFGFEAAIRGMRNPMNSWEKSDSRYCYIHGPTQCAECEYKDSTCSGGHADIESNYILGPNDLDLALRLVKGGPVHAKFRRMIDVTLDITAPLYWWKEFDTYKVGTVANSCSTMHKVHAKPFTIDDFSHEHILGEGCIPDHAEQSSYGVLSLVIDSLNFWRGIFIGEITGEMIGKGDKRAWWQMIQLLPSSYNQKRTIQLNYEVLSSMYHDRHDHKLDEWREFCCWIMELPYSEIITSKSESNPTFEFVEKK